MLQANSLLGCSYVGVAHRESPHSLYLAASLSASEKDSSLLSTTSVPFPPLQGHPVIHPSRAARATSLTHLLSTIWEAPHLHTSHARQGLWHQTKFFSLHPLLWLKSSSWSANKPVSLTLTELEFPDCNSHVSQSSLVHTCCCHSSQASSAQISTEAILVILKSKWHHSHPRSISQSSSFKQDELSEPKIEPHQPNPVKSPSSGSSFPTLVLCVQFSPAAHHLAALLQRLVVLTLSILEHYSLWSRLQRRVNC